MMGQVNIVGVLSGSLELMNLFLLQGYNRVTQVVLDCLSLSVEIHDASSMAALRQWASLGSESSVVYVVRVNR